MYKEVECELNQHKLSIILKEREYATHTVPLKLQTLSMPRDPQNKILSKQRKQVLK